MDYQPYIDRLFNNTIRNNEGCRIWQGPTKGKGYGYLTIGSRVDKTRCTIMTHRLSYMIFNGQIGDFCVLHACDNARCVNPDHLFLGTRADNAIDRDTKGRNISFPGCANGMSILTMKQVHEIRTKYKLGNYTHRKLAKEYNLKCHTSIGDIVRQDSYSVEPPKE